MNKTFFLIGNTKGGTTIFASIFEALGVNLGERVFEGNKEDVDFHAKGINEIYELIEKKNEQFEVWGWKDPQLVWKLDNFIRDERFNRIVVNPHLVFIFRDSFAVAQSRLAKEKGVNTFGGFLDLAHGTDSLMIKAMKDFPNIPKLCVSYERLLRDPRHVILGIAMLIGEFTEEKIKEATELVKVIDFKFAANYTARIKKQKEMNKALDERKELNLHLAHPMELIDELKLRFEQFQKEKKL